MTDMDRFLLGEDATALRDIALLLQAIVPYYADHLRAIAQTLDRAAEQIAACLNRSTDQELE